jgi:hypothetical protein
MGWNSTGSSGRLVGIPLCPDLLRHDMLGEADTWRGRLIRAFFWMLDRVPA